MISYFKRLWLLYKLADIEFRRTILREEIREAQSDLLRLNGEYAIAKFDLNNL